MAFPAPFKKQQFTESQVGRAECAAPYASASLPDLGPVQGSYEHFQASHVVPQQECEAPMNVAVLFHPVIIGCLLLAAASLVL